MSKLFDTDKRRAIRMAIARENYRRDAVPLINSDVAGRQWLVATHRGLFAVSLEGAKLVGHGWFFGIHRHENTIYLFENCALRDREAPLGRIIRFELVDGKLTSATILAKGLHANCHQVRQIDDLICVVDTANQRILRFDADGVFVDSKTPFPPAPATDTTGAYHHLNSIAKIGDRIGIILHNGKCVPEKKSELVWLDDNWQPIDTQTLEGHKCHDIVEDEAGILWHCGSKAGEVISSDGQHIKISDLMTRGIAITPEHFVVGTSPFGEREVRDGQRGSVVIHDRNFTRLATFELDGPPADIVAL